MGKIKRLGKEYKNTCLVQFHMEYKVEKLLNALLRLKMIHEKDVEKFKDIKVLNESDKLYLELSKRMNSISPEGCSFKVRYNFHKNEENAHVVKKTEVGFFS